MNALQHTANSSGADDLPGWKLLQAIKINKTAFRAVQRYRKAALRDGKMHSVITFTAVTGRNTSCEPTLQNVPRDPRFRALVKARPGHVILAVDYAAIELRIAAVLADRAVSDLRRRVRSENDAGWFLDRVTDGVRASQRLDGPSVRTSV
jgi:hypothetical protein